MQNELVQECAESLVGLDFDLLKAGFDPKTMMSAGVYKSHAGDRFEELEADLMRLGEFCARAAEVLLMIVVSEDWLRRFGDHSVTSIPLSKKR